MTTKAMKATVFPGTIAFISYSHTDRKYGAQAKSVLAEIGIDTFLAHDDLHVSDEWRARIIEELKRCDLFVPLQLLDDARAPLVRDVQIIVREKCVNTDFRQHT